jgi:uncharacterized protein
MPTDRRAAAHSAPAAARFADWIRVIAAARTELVLIIATGALGAFYYLTRADGVGAYTTARGWTLLSAPPVPAAAHFVLAALVLGMIPALAGRQLLRMSWRELGLGLGDRRAGLAILAVAVPLALVAGYVGSQAPAMRAVYPLDPSVTGTAADFVPYALTEFLYYGAWEVLFRGVLLFGLARSVGAPMAVTLTMTLSVLAHFGRPMNETFAAIPGGILFAMIALRTRSIWYVAIPHWLMAVSMEWMILHR